MIFYTLDNILELFTKSSTNSNTIVIWRQYSSHIITKTTRQGLAGCFNKFQMSAVITLLLFLKPI